MNAPVPAPAYWECIGDSHSRPRRAWAEKGGPAYLSQRPVEQLQSVAPVTQASLDCQVGGPVILIMVILPPTAVTMLMLEFPSGTSAPAAT